MAQQPPRHTTTAKQVDELIGPDGERLCRWCKKEVQPPKRTFCGDPNCVHEWKIRSDGGYAREQVFKRDRGVCGECGLDTEVLKSLLYKVRTQKGEAVYKQLLNFYQEQYRFNFDLDKHFYEVDHKIPVHKGGGSCGMENLQTLCIPCHRQKSRKEFRARKRKKELRKERFKDFGKEYY